ALGRPLELLEAIRACRDRFGQRARVEAGFGEGLPKGDGYAVAGVASRDRIYDGVGHRHLARRDAVDTEQAQYGALDRDGRVRGDKLLDRRYDRAGLLAAAIDLLSIDSQFHGAVYLT